MIRLRKRLELLENSHDELQKKVDKMGAQATTSSFLTREDRKKMSCEKMLQEITLSDDYCLPYTAEKGYLFLQALQDEVNVVNISRDGERNFEKYNYDYDGEDDDDLQTVKSEEWELSTYIDERSAWIKISTPANKDLNYSVSACVEARAGGSDVECVKKFDERTISNFQYELNYGEFLDNPDVLLDFHEYQVVWNFVKK